MSNSRSHHPFGCTAVGLFNGIGLLGLLLCLGRTFFITPADESAAAIVAAAAATSELSATPMSDTLPCALDLGAYDLPLWAKEDETMGNRCVLSTPRMRVDFHARQLPGTDEVISDWLWIEYGDRVNVLVQMAASHTTTSHGFFGGTTTSHTHEYRVFEQTKYALEGESLAVVGGFIEHGELPEEAAAREVAEEMKLVCGEFTPLGKFRTDVNRGMGWVHPFLARECRALPSQPPRLRAVGDADQERQDLKTMDLPALTKAAMAGRFVEVQWSNTVSLALLRLQSEAVSGL